MIHGTVAGVLSLIFSGRIEKVLFLDDGETFTAQEFLKMINKNKISHGTYVLYEVDRENKTIKVYDME